ncbi:hypothetical protein LXL04_025457 [Taraxacum kok-saghyz]
MKSKQFQKLRKKKREGPQLLDSVLVFKVPIKTGTGSNRRFGIRVSQCRYSDKIHRLSPPVASRSSFLAHHNASAPDRCRQYNTQRRVFLPPDVGVKFEWVDFRFSIILKIPISYSNSTTQKKGSQFYFWKQVKIFTKLIYFVLFRYHENGL